MTVRVFGIRHHGPGSARALLRSLTAWQPETVLVEGPPEANEVLPLAGHGEMRPPVALLAYLPGRPRVSAFYPFAGWSPEWVAVRHALFNHVPVTMIDLPVACFLVEQARRLDGQDGPDGPGDDPKVAPPGGAEDPFSRLAQVAGYDDPERWWDDMIEHRGDEEPWDAIVEAMSELRADDPTLGRLDRANEARREASMRQHIRAAEKAYERVAVVCGAWHTPALVERGPARADAALLVGLTREKAAITWIPWTNSRLAFASGYGAGVHSPGWYEHLFQSPDRPIVRWLIKVANLLRAEQLDASPASVIETVRLADALATLRGRPLAGLTECTDAARAVLTRGDDARLALIDRRLVVGDAIGEVPPETPMVALAADLAAQQRRLRLKPQPVARSLALDLRNDNDLARSHLLHRLDLLEVPWGVLDHTGGGLGTFREQWTLGWDPELSVRVVEASPFGTTVETAARAKAVARAAAARTVIEVTNLLEACLLAELPDAVPATMGALDERAAETSDVAELMDAVPSLARVLRYGSVRRSDVSAVDQVVRGLVARLCVSVLPACASLDDDAATAMTGRISAVSAALGVLDEAELRDQWLDALARLSEQTSLHGLPAGRSSRILLDARRIEAAEVARRLSAALSPGEDPSRGAAWVEGLVAGSGLLLVHDPVLLAIVDHWLATVGPDAFDALLPLLRRSFAGFPSGELHLIGAAVGRLDGRGPGGPALSAGREPRRSPGEVGSAVWGDDVDPERAGAILPLLGRLLGPRSPR